MSAEKLYCERYVSELLRLINNCGMEYKNRFYT